MGLEMTMDMSIQKHEAVLVVDANEPTRKLFKFLLAPRFSAVLTACNINEAVEIADQNYITHLITSFYFGSQSPNGFDLASHLKSAHPSIKKAIVFTGADVSDVPVPPEVDAIFFKPLQIEEALNELCK